MFVIKGLLTGINVKEDKLWNIGPELKVTRVSTFFPEMSMNVAGITSAILNYNPKELYTFVLFEENGHRAQIVEDAIKSAGLSIEFAGNDPSTLFYNLNATFASKLRWRLEDVLEQIQPYFKREVSEYRYDTTLTGVQDSNWYVHYIGPNFMCPQYEEGWFGSGDGTIVSFTPPDLVSMLIDLEAQTPEIVGTQRKLCSDCFGNYLFHYGYDVIFSE